MKERSVSEHLSRLLCSAVASFARTRPMGVLLAEVLSKVSTAGRAGYVVSGTSAYSSTEQKYQTLNCP